MTLQEAINHLDEVIEMMNDCEECRKEHEQLRLWLQELLYYREHRSEQNEN